MSVVNLIQEQLTVIQFTRNERAFICRHFSFIIFPFCTSFHFVRASPECSGIGWNLSKCARIIFANATSSSSTMYRALHYGIYFLLFIFLFTARFYLCGFKRKYSQKDGGKDSILCMVNQLKNQASLFRPFVVGPFALYISLFFHLLFLFSFLLISSFPKSVLYFSTFSFNLSGFYFCLIFLLLCHLFLFSSLICYISILTTYVSFFYFVPNCPNFCCSQDRKYTIFSFCEFCVRLSIILNRIPPNTFSFIFSLTFFHSFVLSSFDSNQWWL